ncbi:MULTISPECIES: DUF5906 domain-containing protein [unclassified Ruegeria]|uniref:DNA primase family protein n=1 Tax=unclassified Ruegeria TaxID=2625375 RepID=UPI0014924432|nr:MULTISPECIES: DUF5906 domain-containing protein [unclassified Ruegeria]NOD35694.1 hypothetical protein [Ruegeria sp. HKCCD7296]NOE43061.1 hypothetical protein [Ruegeria sp. HKCCD7319]
MPNDTTGFALTLVTKDEGIMSKSIYLNGSGKPHNDSKQCALETGTAQTIQLPTLTHLADLLNTMPSNQCITLGIISNDPSGDTLWPLVTKAVARTMPPGTHITRSQDHIGYREGLPGLMLIDFDQKGMPDRVRQKLQSVRAVDAILGQIPGASQVGHVYRNSTSSGLRNIQTGETYPHNGGFHLYLPVADSADIDRALKVLHQRMFLAGFGWYWVASRGALMERSLVDRSVGPPERPIFEGAPFVAEPLVQDAASRAAVVSPGAGVLDTRIALPDLTPEEQAQFDNLVRQSKAEVSDEAQAVRDTFAQDEAQRTGKSIETIRAELTMADKGVLAVDHVLKFDDPEIGLKTVGEVMRDLTFYHEKSLADPMDPDDGRGKAMVFNSGLINSYAHGGAVYKMTPPPDVIGSMMQAAGGPVVAEMPPGVVPVEIDPVVDKVAELIRGDQVEMAYRTVINPHDLEHTARLIVAGYFTDNDRRTLTHWRGDFYRWIGTHWEVMAEDDIKDVLFHFFSKIVCYEKETQDGITRHKVSPTKVLVSNYVAALRAVTKRSAAIEPGWNKPEPGTWRSVQNGILDLDTGKLVAHMPDFFNHTWIDAEWQADAVWTGTRAEAFFNEALDTPDQIGSMQEIYGYLLSGATWLQKGFMFVGEKRTGKGTNIKLLKAMEGNLVYSIRSSLLANQFVMEGAVGKSLMVVPDVRLSKDSDFSAIGELILTVTGEDDVDVQRKNKPVWTGKTTVRLILMSNSILLLRDPDGVLASRFIYLTFPNSFYGREDPELLDALLAERSAILRWAVEGWQRVRSQKRFTVTDINAQMQADAEMRMDPVGQFVADRLVVTGDQEDFMGSEMLFGVFKAYIDGRDVGDWTQDGFIKTLKTKPLKITAGKNKTQTQRGFRGVKLKILPIPS